MTKAQLYPLLGEPHFYGAAAFRADVELHLRLPHGAGRRVRSVSVSDPVRRRGPGEGRVLERGVVRAVHGRPCSPASAAGAAPSSRAGPDRSSRSAHASRPEPFRRLLPFDQSDITPAAADVIRAAADADRAGGGHRALVVGFTDTSGSSRYNLALSKRRAKAVADALVADGVAPDGLSVSWKGKSELAVPTPDGVREPLNRRSTIEVEPVG